MTDARERNGSNSSIRITSGDGKGPDTPEAADAVSLQTRAGDERILAEVAHALRRVRFGTVHLIVQDGRVVQIETTEKTRLT